VTDSKDLKAYEVLAAPFQHQSLQRKKFLSFEISEV